MKWGKSTHLLIHKIIPTKNLINWTYKKYLNNHPNTNIKLNPSENKWIYLILVLDKDQSMKINLSWNKSKIIGLQRLIKINKNKLIILVIQENQ